MRTVARQHSTACIALHTQRLLRTCCVGACVVAERCSSNIPQEFLRKRKPSTESQRAAKRHSALSQPCWLFAAFLVGQNLFKQPDPGPLYGDHEHMGEQKEGSSRFTQAMAQPCLLLPPRASRGLRILYFHHLRSPPEFQKSSSKLQERCRKSSEKLFGSLWLAQKQILSFLSSFYPCSTDRAALNETQCPISG